MMENQKRPYESMKILIYEFATEGILQLSGEAQGDGYFSGSPTDLGGDWSDE